MSFIINYWIHAPNESITPGRMMRVTDRLTFYHERYHKYVILEGKNHHLESERIGYVFKINTLVTVLKI